MSAHMTHATQDLSDHDLVTAFERCTLPPSEFTHRRHLAVGWHYLQRDGFPAGAQRFCDSLRAYVASIGAAAKYHETITWAYMVLMNAERVLSDKANESFEAMIERRPDLLDHRGGAVTRIYSTEQLERSEARRVFVLPERV